MFEDFFFVVCSFLVWYTFSSSLSPCGYAKWDTLKYIQIWPVLKDNYKQHMDAFIHTEQGAKQTTQTPKKAENEKDNTQQWIRHKMIWCALRMLVSVWVRLSQKCAYVWLQFKWGLVEWECDRMHNILIIIERKR